jgi:hypothetical protein
MEAAINTAPMPQPESQRRDNFFSRFVKVVIERIHLNAKSDQKYALGGKNPADVQANIVAPPLQSVNKEESDKSGIQADNSTLINDRGSGY